MGRGAARAYGSRGRADAGDPRRADACEDGPAVMKVKGNGRAGSYRGGGSGDTLLPHGVWFPGAACVGALVDRFIQHCHTMDIDADSWRNKEAEEKSKPKKR